MKKIVLPLDGYKNAHVLLEAMENIFGIEGITDLVSYVKLNDGLHNEDLSGPSLVQEIKHRLSIRDQDIKLFLDLKAFDVSATLENVLKKYINAGVMPDILTVASNCTVETVLKLRKLLPTTKLAMVSVLTDMSDDECLFRFGCTPGMKIAKDFQGIRRLYHEGFSEGTTSEPFDFVVCSAHELIFLKERLPQSVHTIVPAIRDKWMLKQGEHQKRIVGIAKALELQADLIVMGGQLTKGNPEKGITPAESCRLTMEEIKKYENSLK